MAERLVVSVAFQKTYGSSKSDSCPAETACGKALRTREYSHEIARLCDAAADEVLNSFSLNRGWETSHVENISQTLLGCDDSHAGVGSLRHDRDGDLDARGLARRRLRRPPGLVRMVGRLLLLRASGVVNHCRSCPQPQYRFAFRSLLVTTARFKSPIRTIESSNELA